MSNEAPAQDEHRLIIAGFGGQGVLTLGKLLCQAGLAEGRNVTYLPSYGSEVRGGTANCQVVISPDPIYSPLVETADSLVVLNELSYERFVGTIRPDGLLLVNTSTVAMDAVSKPDGVRLVEVPATAMAGELGDFRAANVIMFGAFARASGLVGEDSCRDAVTALLGARSARLAELNVQAFQRGADRVT